MGGRLEASAAGIPGDGGAEAWFERLAWPAGRRCPRCGGGNTHRAAPSTGMPYYACRSCWRHFSVRTGTAMHGSQRPLGSWLAAIRLDLAAGGEALGVALQAETGCTNKTAYRMLRRLRRAWSIEQRLHGPPPSGGAGGRYGTATAEQLARALLRQRPRGPAAAGWRKGDG